MCGPGTSVWYPCRVSGTATLERPVAPLVAPPRPVLSSARRIRALRDALVLATWAAACFSVAGARDLVTSFGGTVSTLGSVNNYLDDASTLLGWLFATAALLVGLRAAIDLRARRDVRRGVAVAAVGTVVLAAGAACSLWSTVLQSRDVHSVGWLVDATKSSVTTQEVQQLARISLGLLAAGWLVLAAGAVLATGGTTREAPVAVAWRRSLRCLAAGFALVAFGLGAQCAIGTSLPTQANVLLAYAPPVLGWLVVAAAAVLAGAALRRSPRSRAGAVAAPILALGAVGLAVWSATILAFAQLGLNASSHRWFADLSKLGAAAAWLGWLVVALGVGVAAMRLTEARVRARHVALPA